MTEDINAVSYCVGMSIAGSLLEQNFGLIDPKVMAQAIADAFEGREPLYSPEQADKIIQQYLQNQGAKMFNQNKVEGEAFLAENQKRNEVSTTPSGLQFEVLIEGDGHKPTANDTVTVHYHGSLIDGTVFDSSIERGQPASFGVNQVIPGWTEALQLMPVGAKYRLYIPQEIAYGANPHPGGPILPFSALIFDVELLEIR